MASDDLRDKAAALLHVADTHTGTYEQGRVVCACGWQGTREGWKQHRIDALLPLITAECSEAARQAAEGMREEYAVRFSDAGIKLAGATADQITEALPMAQIAVRRTGETVEIVRRRVTDWQLVDAASLARQTADGGGEK